RNWLGTTMARVRDAWSPQTVQSSTVASVSLDAYVSEHGVTPDLIKIDVEGAELQVIRGARQLLANTRPMLIFESWPALEERIALYDLLDGLEYLVAPATAEFHRPGLSREAFVACPAMNFVAWNENTAIRAAAPTMHQAPATLSGSVSV